jgi:Methane oxygenase PmoA
MNHWIRQSRAFVVLALLLFVAGAAAAEQALNQRVEFVPGKDKVDVATDGLPVATYCYQDDQISRPYFAHVHVPNGVQITRHHPPIAGRDLTDHGTFHPGIWISFGDLSGNDYWRLKAPVRHAEFIEQPRGGEGKGAFAVRNEYLDQKEPSKVVCEEVARYALHVRPAGYLLEWDSTFTSDEAFYFGDQEEMGLGIRVATPIRAERTSNENIPPGGGRILDSDGRRNGEEIGGNAADWCDYSGTMDGRHVGITLFCHPENFRPSWFHARDYGFLAANPFGQQAFGKGEESKIVIKPGEKLRLRYGVLLHSGPAGTEPDLGDAYQDYVELTR